MKLRFFLTGVIFVFSGLVSRGQMIEMLYQGFENGEASHVTATPAANMSYSTAFHSTNGSRSLELTQATDEVTLYLDTLDFTNDLTLRYIRLEFDHICQVPTNPPTASGTSDNLMGRIYYKRPNQSNWTMVGSSYYNMTEGGSGDFNSLSAFNVYSYSDWSISSTSNGMWKSERFDLNNVMTTSLGPEERKLQIKFVIRQKVGTATPMGKWRFDNIRVTASSEQMIKPTLRMALYPDGYYHPSSRGARIELDATTPLSTGINPDSVYLFYRVGSDPTPVKLFMTHVSGSRYRANIPFFGYDTLMGFYCVVKDNTNNGNTSRFPRSEGEWSEYVCIRGVEQPGILTPGFTGNSGGGLSMMPFYSNADGKSEWVYDSALLAEAGYGPGIITDMRMTADAYTPLVTRPNLQIRMKNVPTNYVVDTSITSFYSFTQSYMHAVYNSSLTIPEMNAGGQHTIQLQDSFYYAGKDLVIQVIYNGTTDYPQPTKVRAIPVHPNKKSIYKFYGTDAAMAADPYNSADFNWGDVVTSLRPAFVLTERKNLPLLYDMGFDNDPLSAEYGLVAPNSDVPMVPGNHSIQVKLKNWGALSANAIQISYSIDGGSPVHYNWTNSTGLAGGATQNVTIATNVALAAGFHTLKVWVEDSLTSAGVRYRDHEPYNDTVFSAFIVCDGPMHGVRRVGGSGADFNTMEEFLFALSRCGIDDSLVVKLAPGEYPPFTMPTIPGSSPSNYVVFQPLNNNRVALIMDEAPADSAESMIVNMEQVSNVRFRNIHFVRRSAVAGVSYPSMVKLGMNSVNCYFEGCTFVDSVPDPVATLRINSLINSNYSNGNTVDGCTFRGGKIGVDLLGMASDLLSQNNTVRNCTFYNQYESAISVQNQSNVIIEKNEMYDVLSNTSYVLLVSECYGTSRITANKIYTSHGAGAMGVSKAIGTATNRFVIANNMVVSNDDGSANLMRSPLNIIQANYADVVYNSVKMTATSRNNIAAATFGGGTLTNSRFLNNIVVCLDNLNYALNYLPASATNNEVGHNVYYSMGTTMNRKGTTRAFDMAEWITVEPADSLSVKVNPSFLNGSLVDLRTFSRQVKDVGIPLTTVTTDMFDSIRSTVATCPGAFEFVSLGYDFEPEALVNPPAVTCFMPAQTELVLRIRNNGTSVYTGSGLSVKYRVNNGAVNTVQITDSLPADDTATIHTGAMLSLPPSGNNDVTYTLRVWTNFSADPNATNDTNVFTVTSKYHPAAPSNVNMLIPYATQATITPTAGVNMWSVYTHTGAPQRPSTLYWYRDTLDPDPFFVGPTLTTDTLRQDTVVYFRQRRAQPMVRITQLEIKRGGSGANATTGETPNAPYWLNSGRKVAMQLTNIGDERACLYGDSIVTVSPTNSLNNKAYRFNDSIFIEPGQSLILQFASGNSVSPANTIHTGSPLSSLSVAYNSNIAFLYKHNGSIEDAVVLGTVANHGAPSYVWTGTGVNMTGYNTSAGIVRVALVGNVNDWRIATNENPMMLNSNDPEWIWYTDNGCDGEFAVANVQMIAPPSVDVDVSNVQLPASSCGLGLENVTVTIRNYGIQPVTGLVMNYNAGGATVTETVPGTLPANGMINFTFSTPLNLSFSQDSLVNVVVWADSVASDPVHANDTAYTSVLSLYTPAAPDAIPARTVEYATHDTITVATPPGVIPVWYDYAGNIVDTGYTSISEILYTGGTRGISYMALVNREGQIGTGVSTNGNTAFPSPYQPGNKYAKQQYIYSASELRSMGMEQGYIDSIAFDLKQMLGNRTSVDFNDFYVSMGMTNDTIFTSTSDWKSTSQVFHRSPLTIYSTDCNNWTPLHFDTPFYWDGVSSVVVQLVHHIDPKITSGVKSAYTAKANTTLHKSGDTDLSPSTMNFVGAGTRGGNRPNIKFFGRTFGCVGPVTNYTVNLINIPAVDVAIMWPDGVDTIVYNSCDSIEFYVTLRNQGASNIDTMMVYYEFDNLAVDSVEVIAPMVPGATSSALVLKRRMAPGRHTLMTVAAANGDLITSNDTINRCFEVRFCGGVYTIAPVGGDYHSFGEAIDTLNVVGVEGPVMFNVANATYNEQVVLNTIQGSSATNTIGFIGSGDSVLLTAATTQNNNYVFFLDSASNVSIRNIKMESRPTGNSASAPANVLVMQKGENIIVDGCSILVKGVVNNANASCVVLGGDINGLTFTNNVVDSGFYSLRSAGNTTGYNNIVIYNNEFRNFWKMGVNLRAVTGIDIRKNRFTAGITTNLNGRSLRGIYLGQVAGSMHIEKNHICLSDGKTGGKMGIQLENINCLGSDPGFVANNMISCKGIGVADLTGLKPCGIWIDSTSANINVFYNTVRVECGTVAASAQFNEGSCAFFTGATVSNIHVMNNIFSNFMKGYTSYVTELNTVTISNFNAYYTESSRPFFWKQYRESIADLQAANSDDANSVVDRPYFVSDCDLHLVMTNFVSLAQYTTDVTDDIDDTLRNQIPAPTIGAHEMSTCTHDLSVVEITKPFVPTDTNFSYPNKMPPNIEGDSVSIVAKFYNNGRSLETNVQWYAYLEGHEAATRTPNRSLGTFNPSQMKIDSVMMPTSLGIINRQNVHVVLVMGTDDCSPIDNDRSAEVFLAPAYNFEAVGTSTASTEGCKRENTTLQITVRNKGFKDIPGGTPLKIGFHPIITQPANISIPTMPDTVEAVVTLPGNLLCNQTALLDLPTTVNLYPTGTYTNIQVRLRGWCHHELDVSPNNDTTNGSVVPSYYTPAPPEGYDTTLAYGTWGAVRASQINSRPIRWYRDSTSTPFFTGNNYNLSRVWNNTPQYFYDSTYYLNCYSDHNCASDFSSVTVHVANRIPNDMAIKEVLAPLGERVYMENDTVRIIISNFGTASQTNIPITYQLKRGNSVVQTVTEICSANIPAGQDYTFTFDELLDITTPTSTQNYSLNIWTDLATDGTRRNDTLRTPHTFRSLAESTYNPQASGHPSFDVTRVSYNEIDFELPPLGRGLTNLAMYNDPDYPVLHVTRGTTDSLFIQVTPLDATQQTSRCKAWVFIDFDRNGTFSPDEEVVSGETFYDASIFSSIVTIAPNASYGYMRMRVAVGNYNDFNNEPNSPVLGIPSDKDGHTIDFLLFVDPEVVDHDIAVTQIVSPRSYLIRDGDEKTISFRFANKGATAIAQPQFRYSFRDEQGEESGTVTFAGYIEPGNSDVVSLPPHAFNYGVTTLTIRYFDEQDTNTANNTLNYEYNRFHIITLTLDDNFEGDNKWYAPTGYNAYSHNYWERGTPTKAKLSSAYSDSNAWVTDLHSPITTGTRGNVSYLYSPIINIFQVKPDTISFFLRRNLTNGSTFHVEFFNCDNKWVKLDWDSASAWYNNVDDHVFDATTPGSAYGRFWIPTNSSRISGDFPELVQFRLVYTTPMGSSTSSSYGEGCAVDDFRIGRAPIRNDAGVVAITHPTAPSYGQTIYPAFLVHNYGTDTIREVVVGYTHYGTYMPKLSTASCLIAPNEEDTIVSTSPFLITSDFPDTFYINTFTKLDGDIYRDNDSLSQAFPLSPLENDVSAHSFIYPLNSVIAGDTNVRVTMRIRNFGSNPIYHARATYVVNGLDTVSEDIDFVELTGNPLPSMQYFNYTFQQKLRANMGTMRLVGIIKSDSNDYIYNDTITKRVEGISSVYDIAAASVIVDSSGFTEVRFQLVIDNRGARGANGFEVGFFIDNDSSTIHREIYSRDLPLPALTTGYHMFDTVLTPRPSGYHNVTGFVHMQGGDNDPTNDTTSETSVYFLDIEAVKVIVEETAQPDCRVFLVLRNNGNKSLLENIPMSLRAVINGQTLTGSFSRRIEPGQTVKVKFTRNNQEEFRIPKSPTRNYVGTGKVTLGGDGDVGNNETSLVEVSNHVEGIPTVENSLLSLEQNYPNPFTGRTTIPFSLPEAANVRFFVIDAMGHIVNSFSRNYNSGDQSITIDMDAYSAGIYYYGIEVNGQRLMKKMILR